jgi:hypothetical protein
MTSDPTQDYNAWEYNVKWEKHGHQLLFELLNEPNDFKFPPGKFFLEMGSDRGEGSTKVLAELANKLELTFITVDMNPELCQNALKIVQAINPKFSAECDRGEDFIANFFGDGDIAVLYLDAYDTMPVGADLPSDIKEPYIKNMGKWSNEEAWNMHLKCSEIADKKLMPGGLICFDDMWRQGGMYGHWAMRSKGFMAVPWLLSQEYEEIKYVDGCVVLRKPQV